LIRKGDHITEVGKMSHLMIVQSQTAVADGMGGSSITWTNGASLWADLRPVSATERTQSDRLMLDVTHTAIVRHTSISATTQRLTIGSRVFNIVGVYDADESRSHLVLTLREDV
jgi:SPP1 family predicted phage head-tail adaptor